MLRKEFLAGAVAGMILGFVPFAITPASAAIVPGTTTANPGFSNALVQDLDDTNDCTTSNCNSAWTGEDQNVSLMNQLANSNPSTETAWLSQGLLANTVPGVSNIANSNVQNPDGGGQSGSYTAAFNWVYAIVKYDGFWAAVTNSLGNNSVVWSGLPNGVSHIDFFVPIPGAILLFASALAGLLGFRRWWASDQHESASAAA